MQSNTSSPRFEFRSFGNDFTKVAERMAQLSGPAPERVRRSDEIYILSKRNDVNNIKIRHGLMDIKVLLRTVDGLEQWGPLMKAEFPVDPGVLVDHVFPALQARLPGLDKQAYSLGDFLALVATTADIQAVNVRKHRHGYSLNDTMCEVAEVDVDGVRVVTVATESTDIAAVRKTMDDLGLVGMENINYLQGIKRIIGMVDKPLAN